MKRLKSWKRVVIFLFLIVMPVAGMCFEELRTDSSFVCYSHANTVPQTFVSQSLNISNDVCVLKYLGLHVQSSIILGEKRLQQKSAVRAFYILLALAALPFYYRFLKYTGTWVSHGGIWKLNYIVRFIHNQDGEKDRPFTNGKMYFVKGDKTYGNEYFNRSNGCNGSSCRSLVLPYRKWKV